MKAKLHRWLPAFLYFLILISSALATTDPTDVAVLQDMYRNLNYPSQLTGWKFNGGDPCGESWKGVSCNASSVIYIDLSGLGLGGYLSGQLNLLNLKQLNLSSNHIQGEMPYLLPPNVTHIDLSRNNFSMTLPYSLAFTRHLRHLNVSHNFLSGPIGNIFTGLQNLKRMDLSYNNFTGDLPSSFGNLTNITGLYLQNNQFTGSVIFLANLQLIDLNIQNNHFSGVLPKQFQYVPNLWIGGNTFQIGGDYPPWDFSQDTIRSDQSINSPPATESNVIENYPSLTIKEHRRNPFDIIGIASTVGGVALVATCAAIIIAVHIERSRVCSSHDLDGAGDSLPTSGHVDYSFGTPDEFPQSLPGSSPPVLTLRYLPSAHHGTARKSFSRRSRNPVAAKSYTIADLQSATNFFSEENLVGEGSLGSVFKAEFSDGQVLAVKNINTAGLFIHEEERFLDVVSNVARLRHPNIVTLVGYCMEHEQHLLVYEYVKSCSLETALHYSVHKHIGWIVRLKFALAIARALDYLHSTCLPPVAHCNLKSANILLDNELVPRLRDCGLAVLRPLTSNSIKLNASELALSCTGYTAPENSQPGMDKLKSDIYAFGVLLLELLTGRKPFDSSRPRQEQSLVKWASPHLHDYNSLEAMVDPTIKRIFPSRSLSRFAEVVSFCIQPEPEFRPTMSEILESLELLNDTNSIDEVDTFEMSFRTTQTGLTCSPFLRDLTLSGTTVLGIINNSGLYMMADGLVTRKNQIITPQTKYLCPNSEKLHGFSNGMFMASVGLALWSDKVKNVLEELMEHKEFTWTPQKCALVALEVLNSNPWDTKKWRKKLRKHGIPDVTKCYCGLLFAAYVNNPALRAPNQMTPGSNQNPEKLGNSRKRKRNRKRSNDGCALPPRVPWMVYVTRDGVCRVKDISKFDPSEEVDAENRFGFITEGSGCEFAGNVLTAYTPRDTNGKFALESPSIVTGNLTRKEHAFVMLTAMRASCLSCLNTGGVISSVCITPAGPVQLHPDVHENDLSQTIRKLEKDVRERLKFIEAVRVMNS